MKNRICLAWFGDLDSTDRGIKASRKITPDGNPARTPRAPKRPSKVRAVEELRQMFGRR
jgi:hypothetical protein